MGHQSQVKRDRGQLRQITKEVLPDLLQHNMFVEIQKEVYKKLETIAATINSRLDGMEEKQRDFQSYIIRELTPKFKQDEVKKEESKEPPKAE